MSRHRKLFPMQTPSNNETECSSDLCGGQFYYISPPPPPPPPLPPLPSPSIFSGDESNGVSPPVIVLFALLSSFLLLLLYYIVVAKSCFGFCKRRRNYEDDLLVGSESDGGGDQAGGTENRSAVDHPIWFITTVGLQQSIINSITVLKYRKSEGLIECTDCSVCLNEFRENDAVRLLPKCSHAFHVTCIDTWLRSHTNCPLCRANIVSNNNNNNERLVSQSNSRGSLDNSTDQIQNDRTNNNNNSNNDQVEEIVSNDDNRVRVDENDVGRSVVVRRSVSMDDMKGEYYLGGQKRDDKFSRMVRLSPVAMKKRSLSCGGIRFLSSRYSNNYQLRLINSILPL